jgi:hypothetical protein
MVSSGRRIVSSWLPDETIRQMVEFSGLDRDFCGQRPPLTAIAAAITWSAGIGDPE